MIRWIMLIIGLAYGWDQWSFSVGIACAAIGYLIGQWIDSQTPTTTKPKVSAPTMTSELNALKQRVGQLEAEIAALKAATAYPPANAQPTQAAAAESNDANLAFAPSAIAAADTSTEPVPEFMPHHQAAPQPSLDPTPAAAPPLQPVRATTTQRRQPVSASPGLIEQGLLAAKNWLFGGNAMVRLGMLILFVGVSFLLKFAADNQMLPIQLRLAGLSLGALVIFAIGWRLRSSRRAYALIMQGGALGLLYFTIYGAMRLYHLLPTGVAFALLALLGVVAAVLAIRQNASPLAVMGICGGFLAPILCSNGSGNHVLLFSYFALLNAGIFGVAWFKAWRSLNLLGFVFTFAIATIWGVLDYRSELRASTQPFVIIFWLFYAGISTLYALKRSHTLKSAVDGTLVFGTPIMTLALQSQLMREVEYGMCYSALIGAGFYLGLTAWLYARRDHTLKLFTEAQLALGVLLATLAIPLAFDGNVTAAMWAIEGAGVVWISLRQRRRLALAFGLVLQFAAGGAVLLASPYYTEIALFNGVYLADALIALAGLFCAWRLQQTSWEHISKLGTLGWLFGGWGLLWWSKANLDEIERFLNGDAIANAQLLLLILTAAIFQQLWLAGIWRQARVVAIALPPALLLIALEQYGHWPHYFALWAWMIAWAAMFVLLYQQDDKQSASEAWQHSIAAWLTWGIFINEIIYQVQLNIHSEVYRIALFALAISAAVALLRYPSWPVRRHWRAYWVYGNAPAALLLLLWGFYSALSEGNSMLPLLNALDLAQVAVLAAVIYWLKLTLAELKLKPAHWQYALLGTAVFVWLNAMLLRTLHHSADVPYQFDALRDSTLVQMSLSLFWSVIALALMLAATRQLLRTLWLIGAALLAVVIVKLFLLDLPEISGIERIGSFIGVGLLLLLIGYLAPLPPPERNHTEEKHTQSQP